MDYTQFLNFNTWLVSIVAVVIVFSVLANYYKRKTKIGRTCNIQGPKPTDPQLGNYPDITATGSLHEYLVKVHAQYGHVVQIWFGKEAIISTASTGAFKDQMKIFDKPDMTFIAPVFGSRGIQFVNGNEARERRQNYDAFLSSSSVHEYFSVFKQTADTLVSEWTSLPVGHHVPVYQYIFHAACKAVGITLFGDYFQDDQNVEKFRGLYEVFWPILEKNFTEGLPVEGTKERAEFDEVVAKVHDVARKLIKQREGAKDRKFIDVVMETGLDDTTILGDILVYLVGGFHSTSITLTWCLYHASWNPDVQEKVYTKLVTELEDHELTLDSLKGLRCLRQFIDETLRLRFVAPIATRKTEQQTTIGGYTVPKNTFVIQALGVVMTDSKIWKNPLKFDPDRFNPDQRSRSPLSFCPFGFAGRRMCPGRKFFMDESMICLASVFRKFRILAVNSEEMGLTYGLLTRPSAEVFVMLEKRDK